MTNSDKRSINRRGHANEHMKTRLRNGGRIAGMGILYDDYSEESYGGYYDIKCRMRTASEFLTPEERAELNGPVITYQKEVGKEMKCLDCKFRDVIEHGAKGFIGETIINCKLYNEINGDMEDCEDFETKEDGPDE